MEMDEHVREELEDILKKIQICEKYAKERSHNENDFYAGQANGFRNSAQYIERLLK